MESNTKKHTGNNFKKEGFAKLIFKRVVRVLSAFAVAIWVVVFMGLLG